MGNGNPSTSLDIYFTSIVMLMTVACCSSRFTSSSKYEQHFSSCFQLAEVRRGEVRIRMMMMMIIMMMIMMMVMMMMVTLLYLVPCVDVLAVLRLPESGVERVWRLE